MKLQNEKELLELFVSKDSTRPTLTSPFFNTNYNEVWASNTHSLLIVNPDILCEKYDKRSLNAPYLGDKNCSTTIKLQSLKKALDSFGKIELFDVKVEHCVCEECGGGGSVYWSYTDRHGREYEDYNSCPVCDGEGYADFEKHIPNGKFGIDPAKIIQIDKAILKASEASLMLMAMEFLHQDEIHHIFNSHNDPNIFKFSKDIILIIQPLRFFEDVDAIVETS